MTTIKQVGAGEFIDTDLVDDPQPDVLPRRVGFPRPRIYAYVEFPSLERVRYGLYRTTGGPTGGVTESQRVGEYGREPLAQYWEFGDAIKEVGERWAFEEVPFVEVSSKKDYDKVLEAMEIDPRDGDWTKPGLYDFRDEPPTFQDTVEAYELSSMEDEAEQALEFMFQGDEWKEAYAKLKDV